MLYLITSKNGCVYVCAHLCVRACLLLCQHTLWQPLTHFLNVARPLVEASVNLVVQVSHRFRKCKGSTLKSRLLWSWHDWRTCLCKKKKRKKVQICIDTCLHLIGTNTWKFTLKVACTEFFIWQFICVAACSSGLGWIWWWGNWSWPPGCKAWQGRCKETR